MAAYSFSRTQELRPVSDSLTEVYQNAYAGKGSLGNFDFNQRKAALEGKKTSSTFCILAKDIQNEKQPVCGFVLYQKFKNEIFIHDLCTTTPKGTGVGAQLLSLVFHEAQKEKLEAVTLRATSKSEPFYKKMSFEEIRMTTQGIDMVNERVSKTAEHLHAIYGVPALKR
jgi:N-acetylglutamate synthase-like GNAT family acetyltransferase